MGISKKRQSKIDAILDYYEYPHTVKETAAYFGIGEQTVRDTLDKYGKGADDAGWDIPPIDFVFAWYDITVDILNALKVRYKAHGNYQY